MKKSDLENRMVVELRDGRRYMVVDDILIRDSGYCNMDDYDEDLTEKDGYEQYDIVKVFSHIVKTSDIKNPRVELLWERPWEPEPTEIYYYPDVGDFRYYKSSYWESTTLDDERMERGLVFKTKEEAVKCAKNMIELARSGN